MSNTELDRLRILEKVKDKRMSQKTAGAWLGITDRQVRNLLKCYISNGDRGLISKKRGAESNNKYDNVLKKKALEILTEHYADYGPTLSAEKLQDYKIIVSRETIRKWMIEAGIWRLTRSKKKKIHQSRKRRSYFGELIPPFMDHFRGDSMLPDYFY